MALAVVASQATGTDGTLPATTAAIDTTGANLLAVVLGYIAGTASILTDSKGNTWSPLTEYGTGRVVKLYYCVPTSVGSGHTFTHTSSFNFPWIGVIAFSGAHATPYDSTESGATVSGTAYSPGSATPTAADCVCVTGVYANGSSYTIDAGDGFTIAHQTAGTGSFYGGIAYKLLSGTPATDPTWNDAGAASGAVAQAFFKPATGGGGATYPGADGCGVFHHDPRLYEFERAQQRREWELARIGRQVARGRRAA